MKPSKPPKEEAMRLGDMHKAAAKDFLDTTFPPRGKRKNHTSQAPQIHFHAPVNVFIGADVPRLALLLAMGEPPSPADLEEARQPPE
jgi:hypothetical protein